MKFRLNGESFVNYGFNVVVDVGGIKKRLRKHLQGGKTYDTKELKHPAYHDGQVSQYPIDEKEFIRELLSSVRSNPNASFIEFLEPFPEEFQKKEQVKEKPASK